MIFFMSDEAFENIIDVCRKSSDPSDQQTGKFFERLWEIKKKQDLNDAYNRTKGII